MNPYPGAVALRYRQSQDSAPKVTAKGRNEVAEKILEIAASNQIPMIKNAELLQLLLNVEFDEPIPETALSAIAEIYSFLIIMDDKYANKIV